MGLFSREKNENEKITKMKKVQEEEIEQMKKSREKKLEQIKNSKMSYVKDDADTTCEPAKNYARWIYPNDSYSKESIQHKAQPEKTIINKELKEKEHDIYKKFQEAQEMQEEIKDIKLTNAKLTNAKLTIQTDDKFTIKQFDFNEGLESVIEVSYGVPKESKVKLFFSTNDFNTFSRNYAEKISDNFVRLIIAVATRVNASWITGGNYDINTSDRKGYSLFVSLRHEDSKLLAVISNVLRSENFGPLPPSRFTISAHRNDDFPLEHVAVEIISKLNDKLVTAIQEMK